MRLYSDKHSHILSIHLQVCIAIKQHFGYMSTCLYRVGKDLKSIAKILREFGEEQLPHFFGVVLVARKLALDEQ